MGKEETLIEIGNTEEADKAFTRTVEGLDQKFCLVPEVVKHGYLNYVMENMQLKKN